MAKCLNCKGKGVEFLARQVNAVCQICVPEETYRLLAENMSLAVQFGEKWFRAGTRKCPMCGGTGKI